MPGPSCARHAHPLSRRRFPSKPRRLYSLPFWRRRVDLVPGVSRSGRPSIPGNTALQTVPIEPRSNPSRQNPRKGYVSCGKVLVHLNYTSTGTTMPHRELLTKSQRLSLQAPASDERGMVRHYTLSSEDLALVNRRRGDPNRLGFALMLCYLRFPGRILQQSEQPPVALCAFVAEQLGLDAAHFGDYAERDQTRREHVLEIETALGLRPLTGALYRELAVWLLPTAPPTDPGRTLVATLLEELRAWRIA